MTQRFHAMVCRGTIFVGAVIGFGINTTTWKRKPSGTLSRLICRHSRSPSKKRLRRGKLPPELDYLAEAADAFVNFPLVEARVAKHEADLRGLLEVAVRDSVDADASGCGFGDDGGFGDTLPWPKHDVRAGAVASDFDARLQIFVNGFHQGVAACSVSVSQTTQVALVHSGRDELREGLLLERGGVQIVEPFGRYT